MVVCIEGQMADAGHRSISAVCQAASRVWSVGSDKLKECVHGDNYINGCRLLAVASLVTPPRALAYSWSGYIIKVSILMNYD